MLGMMYCKKHLWDYPIKTLLKMSDTTNLEENNTKDKILQKYYLITQNCQLCSATRSWYEPVEPEEIGDNNVS